MKETTAKREPQKAASIKLSKVEAETVFQRMTDMLKRIVSVPKSEIAKRETEYKKRRAKKKSSQSKSA